MIDIIIIVRDDLHEEVVESASLEAVCLISLLIDRSSGAATSAGRYVATTYS